MRWRTLALHPLTPTHRPRKDRTLEYIGQWLIDPGTWCVELDLKNHRLVPEKAIWLAEMLTHPSNRLEFLKVTLDYLDSPSLVQILSVLNDPNCKLTHLTVIGASKDLYGAVETVLAEPDCRMKEIWIGSKVFLPASKML